METIHQRLSEIAQQVQAASDTLLIAFPYDKRPRSVVRAMATLDREMKYLREEIVNVRVLEAAEAPDLEVVALA